MKNKILLVDDEPEILSTLKYLLVHEGFEVETVLDGEAAFELLSFTRFDAIVCDLIMPRLDGMGLLKRIRGMNMLLPFIFLSGHAGEKEELEVTSFGAYELIHKPHLNLIAPALQKLLHVDKEVKILQRSGEVANEFLELLHNTNKKAA